MDVMQEAKVLRRVEAVLRRQEPSGLHGLLELFVPFLSEPDLTILLVDGLDPGLLRLRLLHPVARGVRGRTAHRSDDRERRNPPRAQK